MKRFLKIALALALIVSLAACGTITINVNIEGDLGGSSKPVAAPTQAPTAAPTAAPTEAPAPTESTTAAPAEPGEEKPTEAPAPSGELSASSSKEEIVAKYAEVYNTTKAAGTFKGHDTMSCTGLVIDGKENGTVKKLADGLMKAEGKDMPLPPYSDDNPSNTCLTKADDVDSATYADNGDGTATITLKIKETKGSKKFNDPAGNAFNVMEDVASALAGISAITWSEGDANSNTVLTSSGTVTVTFDKSSNMMTKADYILVTVADVQHANVLFLKDKSATATFEYGMVYPG